MLDIFLCQRRCSVIHELIYWFIADPIGSVGLWWWQGGVAGGGEADTEQTTFQSQGEGRGIGVKVGPSWWVYLLDSKETDLDTSDCHDYTLPSSHLEIDDKLDLGVARYPQLCFNYKDPERNFDHSSVKGLVCKLIKLRDASTATALEVTAGGKVKKKVLYKLWSP